MLDALARIPRLNVLVVEDHITTGYLDEAIQYRSLDRVRTAAS